jgi:aminoglycoside phosphotransferase (APT) family kinase protein
MTPDGTPPPYGFDLTPAGQRLLRAQPPPEALLWCAHAVGAGAQISDVYPLAGGTSSAVHAVDIEDRRRRLHRLVLRRLVKSDWLQEEPDAPYREATALKVARACPLPTPTLVALDAEAEVTDVPALLMTRVQGSIEWHPSDLDRYLRELANAVTAIHATAVPADATAVRIYAPYPLVLRRPPTWSARPELWLHAFEVFDRPPSTDEPRFIHRDYHPGNVL